MISTSAVVPALLALVPVVAADALVRSGVQAAARPTVEEGTAPAASDTTDPAWSRLTGTYRLADGRLLLVWDLADHLPDGAHQLAAFEPESGWLRTLVPDGQRRFRFGSGWFAPEPEEGRLEFGRIARRLTWVRGDDSVVAARLSLRRREVTFGSDEGVVLAGEVILPPEGVGRAPYPGLVMIPGSGTRTRRSPRVVADQYAAAGLAVLVHDKRGSGGSTGTFTPGAVPELARDAAAALSFLRTRPEVDARRIGVMASSLGGVVAPLVHREDPDWAFFVCRVCPSVPIWEQQLQALAREGRDEGLPPSEILDALARRVLAARYAAAGEDYDALRAVERSTEGEAWRETLGHPSDWRPLPVPDSPAWDAYRSLVEIDPSRLYREIDAPTLVILGEYDRRLPGEVHASEARRAFERGSSEAEKEVWVLPRASHGLMEVEFDDDGRRRPFRRYVPGWHGRMVRWVMDQIGERK